MTHPSSIPKAPSDRVKTNRIDSEKIAQELKSCTLKSIRVPREHYRELIYLIQTREDYSRAQKCAKQRIKALLLQAHLYPLIPDPDIRWSKHCIQHLKNIQCSYAVRMRLNLLINDLEYSRNQLLAILRTLKTFCKNIPEVAQHMRYLQSISGIGFITAVTILGRIGDPKNLKDQRELASFVGIVPSEYSTGDTVTKGSITHLGNQTLRSLLIEASWSAIRKNTELNQFYHRIKSRHHLRIGARVAIVAVARKLTHIIYRVLKDQRTFIVR